MTPVNAAAGEFFTRVSFCRHDSFLHFLNESSMGVDEEERKNTTNDETNNLRRRRVLHENIVIPSDSNCVDIIEITKGDEDIDNKVGDKPNNTGPDQVNIVLFGTGQGTSAEHQRNTSQDGICREAFLPDGKEFIVINTDRSSWNCNGRKGANQAKHATDDENDSDDDNRTAVVTPASAALGALFFLQVHGDTRWRGSGGNHCSWHRDGGCDRLLLGLGHGGGLGENADSDGKLFSKIYVK
jgi:hypothetical protein